jgi:hypothetical protein
MRIPTWLLGTCALAVLSCAANADEDDGFITLFDGKSLAGWEGNLDVFRIQDGAIVGGSLKTPVSRNEYLCTKQEYTDFELRLQFRIRGADTNAGIQIRSQRVPDSNEMIGYQADVGQDYWGCLYCERRHKLLAGPTPEQQAKICNADGWNQYVIRCEGRRIRLWMNGHQTVDYIEADEAIPQTGVIGLQIHQGPPAQAQYKEIKIRELRQP